MPGSDMCKLRTAGDEGMNCDERQDTSLSKTTVTGVISPVLGILAVVERAVTQPRDPEIRVAIPNW
jgi:hypothetical protein